MILASALMLVSCVDEMSTESFDNIKLDKTMLVLPVDGGSVTLTVNATEDWAFDTLYTKDAWPNVITRKKNDAGEYYVSKVEASWLSVDKMAGAAGETVLTFSADSVAGGREIELCIKAGLNSQFIKVRQGSMEASSATCAEVIAGPDGKTYRVKGVCTSIANTQYGNWYLNDGTGEVYVYGTLDKDGKTKNYESWGMEVGDVVEVEGPKLTYGTTIELVDVTVIKIEKSLVKVITEEKRFEKEGGEFELKVAFKGEGLYPVVADTCKSWVSIVGVKTYAGTPTKIEPNPADTAVVTFSVAEFMEKAAPRSGYIALTSAAGKSSTEVKYNIVQKGDIPEPTPIKDVATVEYAYVEGTVVALCARGYILADETGAMLIYYGSSYDGSHKVGDKMGILGAPSVYNFAAQISTIDFEQKLDEGQEVKHPEAVDYNGEKVNELVKSLEGKDKTKDVLVTFDYVKMTGKLSISGSNVNITIPGSEAGTGSLYYALESLKAADFDGKNVTVEGYVNGVSGGKYINVVATSLVEASGFIPELSLSKTSDKVEADATEYSLDVTANLKWTATPSEGLTLDVTSGEGNATVKMTFAANETEEDVQYTVTFKAEGLADKTFTLTQAKYVPENVEPTYPTIAEVRALEPGAEAQTKGMVVATHQQGYIISDETGLIYVYTKDVPQVAVGNTVVLSGKFDNYYGTLQLKEVTVDSNDNATAAPVYPEPIDLTDQAAYDAYATFSKDNPTDFAYVKIKGVLTNGRYITVGTSTKQSQLDWSNGDYSALNDKTVIVTAYIKGFHSKGYYQIIETSVEEVTAEADPWAGENVVSYDLPESASPSRQVLRNIKYYADAENVNIRLVASVSKIGEVPTNGLTISFYDKTNGTTGKGFYEWWNKAIGDSEYNAERCGTIDGSALTMTVAGADVPVETTVDGDLVTWTFAFPRSADVVLANDKVYMGVLTLDAAWNATGAMPDKYADMFEVVLP